MSRHKLLLVLDDDATVAQILVAGAELAGFAARHFDEPAAFLAAVAALAPSHVAVDLTLPGTSGIEVLRQLAEQGSDARILIVSGAGASDLSEALAEAQRLGLSTSGGLQKPFRQAQLRALLGLG
jgi:FixJ family two-component response regulator